MTENFFADLKGWSARKHVLLTKYLESFTKILGGSKGVVYFVDGFAGPGLYGDNDDKGSPILAAEYALSLVHKPYSLQCINVEANDEYFNNLEKNTHPYRNLVTNFQGTFAQNVDTVLTLPGQHPTLFFLDPFGVKDVEWPVISKILNRSATTELLLRIDTTVMSRLAGFYDHEEKKGGKAKLQRLNNFLGVTHQQEWHQIWEADRKMGLILFYLKKLTTELDQGKGAYGCIYPIKEIEGKVKYYLGYVTRHPKGVTVMGDIVYAQEETYELEVEEYKKNQPYQMSLFDTVQPTKEEIFAEKVKQLKEDIWQVFQGKMASRIDIRVKMAMKKNWFGKVKGSHFTKAFKGMEKEGQIIKRSGNVSDPYTKFTFKA